MTLTASPRSRWTSAGLVVLGLWIPAQHASGQDIVTILDATGDGGGNILDAPQGTAIDSDGNLFVTGFESRNVFQVTPGGTVTEIVDGDGDGSSTLRNATAVATDGDGNVYVAAQAIAFGQAFKIATPGSCSTSGTPCTITEIIGSTGDGVNGLNTARAIETDSEGNVYVIGFGSDNVYRIAAPDGCSTSGTPCTITEIADSTGDGTHAMGGPYDLVVDLAGNVYFTALGSDNVFRISTPGSCSTSGTPCTITEILDGQGDGNGNTLDAPIDIALGGNGSLYVTGQNSNNAFRIQDPSACSTTRAPCVVTEIVDNSGDGTGGSLSLAWGVAVDPVGNVFVGGRLTNNILYIQKPDACSTSTTPCFIREAMDSSGDGMGNFLDYPFTLTSPGPNRVYVPGRTSDTVLSIESVPWVFEDDFESGDTLAWSDEVSSTGSQTVGAHEERDMKKFVLLHYGFQKPTPEIMKAWGAWFESIADKTVENLGFGAAREISAAGTKDLPWGTESITGCSIIEAESLDEAERIARDNPFIASIRVYEVREK